MSLLKERFNKEIVFSLKEKFEFSSIMQVPKVEKIVVNVGCGISTQDKRYLEASFNELELITGQKPQVTKAKKSIADFKLREGQSVGLKVTLRNQNMWSFMEKLFNVALPRTRDFKGIKASSFDKNGNLTLGIKEQIIFTEIHYDDVKKINGMDITFVISSDNIEHSKELLLSLGCPFSRDK